ncbi:MAG: ABC transporter permease [Cyclobacteriaceae bacterium]
MRPKPKKIPPSLATRLLTRFLRNDLAEEVRGDLDEKFYTDLKNKSTFKSKINYWYQVLNYLRPFAIQKSKASHLNQYDMFQSYFKIGWRNLLHNKGFSFINIFGLAMGMTACVLIMLYVVDEMSYDKHHLDGNRVYRIAEEARGEKWVATVAPMAESLKKDFPEVEQAARLLRFPGAEKILLKDEQSNKQFFETNGYYVDSTFFQLFSYDFKYGDIRTALNEPNSIVISEQLATKFFGNENPIDSVLKVGLSFGEFNYTIKGVFKNTKNKSHISANLLLSMHNGDVGGWVKMQTGWSSNSIFHTYVKLKEGTSLQAFESKLSDFLKRNSGEDFKAAGFTPELFIQPLKDIYLHSNFGYEVAANGNMKYLYIFTSIAAFLLLIACINFMNLSTACSEKRAKEVGLRRVVGAGRSSLISQFLSESLLMSGLALALAFLLIQVSLPFFNQLTNKELSLTQVPHFYSWLILLTLSTGLLSGVYPAFYLSSFKPVAVLKGKLINTLSAVSIRKGLVIFQFAISTVLIVGAIVIGQQMNYLASERLGFDKSQKIILPLQTSESKRSGNTLTDELLNQSQIIAAAKGGDYPGIQSVTSMLFYGEGKSATENVDIHTTYAEPGYIETLGIQLLRGRGFSKEFANDHNNVILNETAINKLGYTLDNAVGKRVYFELEATTHTMTIIGVVKDYHFQSLHQKIKPLTLTVAPIFSGPNFFLILNVKTSDYSGLVETIQKTWKKINPNSPFAYSFLDQDFQRNYEKEEFTLQLISYFTLIAIVIACLGLFGLASFTAEQRVKEIGIRKVLGSSISQIVMLLSKDFLKLVIISFAIASPIGYYVMKQWLQSFAYHVNVSWWVFAVAGTSSVLIAILTIGVQSIKAAVANPANSLKSE